MSTGFLSGPRASWCASQSPSPGPLVQCRERPALWLEGDDMSGPADLAERVPPLPDVGTDVYDDPDPVGFNIAGA